MESTILKVATVLTLVIGIGMVGIMYQLKQINESILEVAQAIDDNFKQGS